MSGGILSQAVIYINGLLVSTLANLVELDFGNATLENVTFEDKTQIYTAGLRQASIRLAGLLNPIQDKIIWDAIQTNVQEGSVIIIIPNRTTATLTVGDPCYMVRVVESTYSTQMQVGDLIKWDLTLEVSSDMVRGVYSAPIPATPGTVTLWSRPSIGFSTSQPFYVGVVITSKIPSAGVPLSLSFNPFSTFPVPPPVDCTVLPSSPEDVNSTGSRLVIFYVPVKFTITGIKITNTTPATGFYFINPLPLT